MGKDVDWGWEGVSKNLRNSAYVPTSAFTTSHGENAVPTVLIGNY